MPTDTPNRAGFDTARDPGGHNVTDTPNALTLSELRKRLGRSQVEVAEAMGTTQSGVSRIERQQDIKVSTLAQYVSVLGGRLRLVVEHESGAVEIAAPSPGVVVSNGLSASDGINGYDDDQLHADLHDSRERLCRALCHIPPHRQSDLDMAIKVIDQAGSALLPDRWSRHNQPEYPEPKT